MLILAVDSATPVAGAAIMEDDKILCEQFVNYKKTHSETLMPMIDQVLKTSEKFINDLDAIAVTVGPGSFTGLRIGLAAVKGLSIAQSIPVVALSTLDVLANNVAYQHGLIAPLLNARKQEVYTAFYKGGAVSGVPIRVSEEMACSPETFVMKAKQIMQEIGFSKIMLLGDGYLPYKDFLHHSLGEGLSLAPPHCMFPRAAALAALAAPKVEKREFADVYALRPTYIRLSEAEYRLGKGEL